MRQAKLLIAASFLFLPLVLGCGGRGGEPDAVAGGDEIEQFLAENPEMAVDAEEEAALMAGDATEEEQ
jgi:hypothetical protein